MKVKAAVALLLLVVVCVCGGFTHGLYTWNGRLVQISLGFNGCPCDWPFLNYELDGSEYQGVTSGLQLSVDFSTLNQFGYPSSNTNLTSTNGWAYGVLVPSTLEGPGFIKDWVGYASFNFANGNGAISSVGTNCVGGATQCVACANSSGTVTGTSCVVNLTISGVEPTYRILSVGTGNVGAPCGAGVACPQLTQSRLYLASNQAAVNLCSSGILTACFSQQFLSAVSNFGVLRFINKGNYSPPSNITRWSDRTPAGYRTYGVNYWPSYDCSGGYNLASCMVTNNTVTLSSGAEYTLAFTNFALTDKAHVLMVLPGITAPNAATNAQSTAASCATTCMLSFAMVPASVVPGMRVADESREHVIVSPATVSAVDFVGNTVTLVCSLPCTNPLFGTVQNGDNIYFSPMLNINSTGYLPVVAQSGDALGFLLTPGIIANEWSALTYDAGLNVYMTLNLAAHAIGLNGQWPPEIKAGLANAVHEHVWDPSPCYAFDQTTDYLSSEAAFFKSALAPSLKHIIEGPNEDWNPGFYCTFYSDNKQFLLDGVNSGHANWYGTQISKLGQLYSTTFGADRTKYGVYACMQQAALPTRLGGGEDNKLQSPYYVAHGGSAAYNWVTNVCPASYYDSIFTDTVSEIGWAYTYSVAPSSVLVGDYLAGVNSVSSVNQNLYWLQHTAWPAWGSYIASYNSAYSLSLKWSMYEGGYGQNGGFSQFNTGTQKATIASFTPGSPSVLTVNSNAWNYICNTASLCTGSAPTGAISGTGCAALDGKDPAIQSATATTVTVNLDSTGCSTSASGSIVYDGAGTASGFMQTFEVAVMQDTTPTNLAAWELLYLQGFYSAAQNAGVTPEFPAEYDLVDGGTSWGKYYKDLNQTKTPVITAVGAFQQTPYLLNRDLDPASRDSSPAFLNMAA